MIILNTAADVTCPSACTPSCMYARHSPPNQDCTRLFLRLDLDSVWTAPQELAKLTVHHASTGAMCKARST